MCKNEKSEIGYTNMPLQSVDTNDFQMFNFRYSKTLWLKIN